MDHERLSALDTAFLCLESQEAPMHLGALAVFQPQRPIEPSHLLGVVADRVERRPSLRQRVRLAWLPPGAAVWAKDGLFHLPSHLQLHRLTEGDQHTLATLAGELMAEPLDLDRPLWQIHLVTGLAGGRFAVLVKLHHAMADGLRAVELGIGLLDGYTDLVAAQASAVDGPDTGSWLPSSPSSSLSLPSSWSSSLPFLMGAAKAAAGLALRPDRLIAGVARTAVGLPADLLRAAASMPGDVVRTATSLPGAVRHAADAVGIASSILASARSCRPSSAPRPAGQHSSTRNPAE
jgi:diacylglycerol O-acyltransferase / wax synthase